MLAACVLLCCSCTMVTAIQRADMFPYGTLNGDSVLREGDDETSKVLSLPRPLYFFNSPFSQLYVATNGIISAQDLPMEKQYVDDGFPTDFPVVAPFLADIDTSGGRGQIYYRVTEIPSVLNRVEVHRGFPDANFTPTHAVVATWENVPAYEEQTRPPSPPNKVNTFQAVIGYDETDSYVLFLYPEGGLNFFGTLPKESYNVEIELPARVGFSRGEIPNILTSRNEGPYYSVTSNEQSVKNLYQFGNSGIPGLWLFHTGNRYSFDNIVPASIKGPVSTPPTVGYDSHMVILLFSGNIRLMSLNVVSLIQYTTENKETCARFLQQCSQNAFCTDYATGFCCHCQPGFYGNGRQCLPDGAPQRVSGKVSGTVYVGSTPVSLNNIDLHAYIVVGDGRAYTAISEVPEPVGWALMPVAPIGELFGWLFALELQNSQAGFKLTGAEFSRHAEVVFYPGNQRLSIIQTARGLDDHNHLTVGTVISGSVPFLPPGAEVTMEPFKETYQYYPSVATSTSIREYSVVTADRGSESFSFQLKQNITYRDCPHNNQAATPETLQILMERVFVMFVKEERILRYAITNKISPVRAPGPELHNPCYAGTHDCDTTAQCIPLEDLAFQCQCATGYTGDGHNCYDIDECAEGLGTCGDNSECVNLPGSHRCHCQRGYEFGYDGRTCVDIDECSSSPCHINARCINGLGSFQCQCQLGFFGNGFYCSQLSLATHEFMLFSGLCVVFPKFSVFVFFSHSDRPERLKTRCEHHRDSVKTTSADGYPITGVYKPQCDAEGQYLPQQCHGSTGYCWCVDSRGEERAGTRTPPGAAPVDCDRPEHVKTHCEHHRDSVKTTSADGYPIVGAYVPQCDAEGQYLSQQCHGSTGYCWCVDSRGEERAGTRTPPGAAPVDCDRPEHLKTHCEHHRDSVKTTSADGYPITGVYKPQCDAEGQYLPQQCHGSTGYCWCVDSRGEERAGTRTPPGAAPFASLQMELMDHPVVALFQTTIFILMGCFGVFGFPLVAVTPTERPESMCERWRASLIEHYGGKPGPQQYVPQCEPDGEFSPVQCYGETNYCWCVDQNGRMVPGTKSDDAVKPACISSVPPPTVRPTSRPDVTPPINTGITLLYAQGQKIGALPLNGTRLDESRSKTLLALHGSIVVGIAYDCKENQVYWTDLSARSINRASMVSGAEPEVLINTNLVSPEGLAVDVKRRLMFWVDSTPDVIERANLDGSGRRTLFDTDLVNPRAIIVVSSTGTLYWTDWNREAPKIESSSVDGQNRQVIVSDGIGLPNALTYDSATEQICWADAGTKRLECISSDGSGRRVIHANLNYPFSMVYYRNHFYYTDWRRDGVIAVNKHRSLFTDEYLPEQRSHLYGITVATTHCLPGEIYCVIRVRLSSLKEHPPIHPFS
uniref:Nidogen 2a (osteonidogen) n=1 Tax=Astatotilapia calliptera TaxID=8154 RepID=A0A3P8RG51_ASTCA